MVVGVTGALDVCVAVGDIIPQVTTFTATMTIAAMSTVPNHPLAG